jgi:CRP/FNR family transcriptional regulator
MAATHPASPDTLLAALPAELTRGLFAKARVVSVPADQMVFLAGDAGDGCYRVEEGLLKVSVVASEGAERILAILGPGSIVGELSMIDSTPRSASVAALRDSKLSFISRATFEPSAGQSGHVQARDDPAGAAARHQQRAGGDQLPLGQGTVARALLSLAEAFGHDVGGGRILAPGHAKRPAAMAGIARENVSRILKDWTDRAW